MARNINTETYEGPGTYASAAGQSYQDSMIYGNVAGAAAAAGGIGLLKADGKQVVAFSEKVGKFFGSSGSESTLSFFTKHPKFVAVTGLALAASLVAATVTSLTGFAKGAHKAAAGKQQFEVLKSQRDEALARASAAEAQVGAISQAMGSQRRFTDSIQSRGAQGSFADAALADKANAAEAAR